MGLFDFLKRKDLSSGTATKTIVGLGIGPGQRLRFKKSSYNKLLPYALMALIALMLADLTGLSIRSRMIPQAAPPARRQNIDQPTYKPRMDYNDILARNIFNSDGLIPDVQVAGEKIDTSGPARESQLPLTLVGTIVHANPGKSVATIQMKNAQDKVLPYIPNDDIEGLATLIKVERKKAFIRNVASGGLEYIAIKDDTAFTFQKKPVAQVDNGPVQKQGDNTFGMERSELEKQMSNLPQLLTQARAVPNMVGGRVDGFRILDVQEGSLYTSLGIKNGDIIKTVGGEPIDSPAKAMELYNGLRSQNQVQLTIERNGKSQNMTYNIH